MIKFEIDGKRVNLSKDYNFSFYQFNTMLDVTENKGSFSYDIDVDLNDPQNAIVYKHIDRINAKNQINNRTAKFWVGSRLLFQGIETILKVEKNIVKIQVLCGNSEFNFTANDQEIISLDLGSLNEYKTESKALETRTQTYPSAPCVCCPIVIKDIKYPNALKHNLGMSTEWSGQNSPWFRNYFNPYNIDECKEIIPQPYLTYVVEKVFNALGWTIDYNIMRTDNFCRRLICVHGHITDYVNAMIPNWKAGDFLKEVQKFCNLVFIADSIKKTISIYKTQTYYENLAPTISIKETEVVQSSSIPSKDYNSNLSYDFNYNKVKYSMPETKFYKHASIDDEVMDLVTLMHVDDFYKFNYREDPEYSRFFNEENYNKPNLCVDSTRNFQILYSKKYIAEMSVVNQFHYAEREGAEEGDDFTELNIIPAEVKMVSFPWGPTPGAGAGNTLWDAVDSAGGWPYAINNDFENILEEEATDESGLNEWIVSGPPEGIDTSNDKLCVAQYMGLFKTTDWWRENLSSEHTPIPLCFGQRYADAELNLNGANYSMIVDTLKYYAPGEDEITFDLKKALSGRFNRTNILDDKVIYTFYLKNTVQINTLAIYNINCKKFIPISFEHKLNGDREDDYIIGKFLAYK